MSERHYIVFEGAIGAGKTTLATIFAERLDGRLVEEKFEENPFLIDFYRDPRRYAFQTELFFLLSRYRQQTEQFAQPDLFQRFVFSDYHFVKNRIFAHLTLDEREYQLYDMVANRLEKDILPPDLMVYLQSTPERLMKNIRKRDRSFERNMNLAYIVSLVEAYNQFFFHYDASPLLIVNSTAVDFAGSEAKLDELMEYVLNAPNGTSYYNPAPEEIGR
ncbi:deoxynucleoside kinase [bacterium]|nr:deoxynucleoside kinase [bacterium]